MAEENKNEETATDENQNEVNGENQTVVQPGVLPITEATPEGYAVTPEQHERNSLWQTGNVATNGAGPSITEVSHVFDEARAAAFGLFKDVEDEAVKLEDEAKAEVNKLEGKKSTPAKSAPAKASDAKPGDEAK